LWAGIWGLKNGVGKLFSQAGCLQITGRSGTLTTSDTAGSNIIAQEGYSLQTYPNPFSGNASVFYELPAPEVISLYVTDITGRKIATIRDNELMTEGRHTDQFYADNYGLAPGIYFLRMQSRDYSKTIKIVLER
jgi:hypothetical protein